MTDNLENTPVAPLKVLVTGANGFVGTQLCAELQQREIPFRAAVRQDGSFTKSSGIDSVTVGSISEHTEWSRALIDIDTVIHLAARVHVMQEAVSDPLAEFRKLNVDSTMNLARQAQAADVRRFIFISSIKVNGEETLPGQPYSADDAPAPVDPYGVSKLEAENALRLYTQTNSMDYVVIRPPLVYGSGVKGNFQSMMDWLFRGIPFPLASVGNKRSLVAVDNLVDLIITCIRHPAASNQTFLISDGEDLSTPDLLQRTASALGRKAYLFPAPIGIIQVFAGLLGKRQAVQRLCGSLQVNVDKTCGQLGWKPPVRVDEALYKTAQYFLRSRR